MSMAGQATDPYEVLRERRAEVPARFSLQGPVRVQTADLDPVSIFRSLVKPSRIPLFRLHVFNRSYRPVRPILVHLSQEDEWFFAENEALRLVGSGTSAEAAILDLEQHIVHFWNMYKQLPDDKVTGDAIRLKNVFSGLLVEE